MKHLPRVVIAVAFVAIVLATLDARSRRPRLTPRPQVASAPIKAEESAPVIETDPAVARPTPPPPPTLLAQKLRADRQMEDFLARSIQPEGHHWGTNCATCHVAQD